MSELELYRAQAALANDLWQGVIDIEEFKLRMEELNEEG